jgi:hypothetical protein
MTTTTQSPRPFELAERELSAADAEVAKIEREVAPVLDKFAALHEQLDNLTATVGADAPASRKAAAAIAALSGQVIAARTKLEREQRRRSATAERFDSERRAIALARIAVTDQERRVGRQADALAIARREVREKEIAADHEERELLRLRGEMQVLTGNDEHAPRGAR